MDHTVDLGMPGIRDEDDAHAGGYKDGVPSFGLRPMTGPRQLAGFRARAG
jgi:hypothetical protein